MNSMLPAKIVSGGEVSIEGGPTIGTSDASRFATGEDLFAVRAAQGERELGLQKTVLGADVEAAAGQDGGEVAFAAGEGLQRVGERGAAAGRRRRTLADARTPSPNLSRRRERDRVAASDTPLCIRRIRDCGSPMRSP